MHYCSGMYEAADDNNEFVFAITAIDLALPLGYYISLYLLGSFHLILSFWMLAEYLVTVMPNLSFRCSLIDELL